MYFDSIVKYNIFSLNLIVFMSGHSKWSKVKRQKGVKDQQKSTIFAKCSRAITLAVVEGGHIVDPALNIKLRLAIEKAKVNNMPKDTIMRAIEKGSSAESANLREFTLEAYGPAGSIFIIQGSTDNTNRTLSVIRNVLGHFGGKLGAPGSVVYQFHHIGHLVFDANATSLDTVMDIATLLEAIDVEKEESEYSVIIPASQIGRVHQAVGDTVMIGAPEVFYQPTTPLTLDESHTLTVERALEALEELEEVHAVYTNVML